MSVKPPAQRRPTIIEVARLAGVSHQTVSRYLRFEGGLKNATSERVAAAIAELDYRPNLVARAMRSRKTGRLALLLPNGTAVSSLEMLAGAAAEAHEAGFFVELVTLAGPPELRAARVLELADSGLFEGIVSLTPLPLPQDRLNARSNTPVVVSPNYDEQMRGIGEVADASSMVEIVEGLANQGHRTFLHVSGDYAHSSARQRRAVYLNTLQRLGLRSFAVADCSWSAPLAHQAVLDLPEDSGVTAVIAANDSLAAGAISGARERGWEVPRDLSVTGWDNNPVAAAMDPALTSVSIEHAVLGRHAVAQLLTVLGDHPQPPPHGPITHVMWRTSTGPAPRP